MHLFLYSQALPVITLLIVSSSRLQPPQNTKKTQDVVVIPYSLKHAIILKVLKKQIYKHAHRKRREVIEVKKTRKECYKCKFLAAKEYFDFNKKSTTQRNKILELEFSFFKYSC